MQKKTVRIFTVAMCFMLIGCSKSPDNSSQKNEIPDMRSGDYYSFISVEGDYKVLKVLLVEDNVVHFCYYNNVFQDCPSESVVPSLFFGKKRNDTFIDVSKASKLLVVSISH